jgi:hypothetical protein
LLAPCYLEQSAAQSDGGLADRKQKKKQKQGAAAGGTGGALAEYVNSEDFVFATHAHMTFNWALSRPAPTPGVDVPPQADSRPQSVKVLVLTKGAFVQAVSELKAALG